MRIGVDMTRCQSYAQCCFLAPEAFVFDGEEALVYDASPPDADRFRILQAAAACPVQAIRIDHRDLPERRGTVRATRPQRASTERVVIVGASLAGLRAAEAVRAAGFAGRLTMVGDETDEPYDRPPLSKQVLLGTTPASGTTLPRERDVDADWRLGSAATGLDLVAREVLLDGGDRLPFDRLLVATGARAREWPAEVERGLDGVVTLRTAADAADLRERLAARPARVLVIGGGFTGSEVASVCRELGLEVTLVDRGPAPLARALGDLVGDVVAAVQREHGVDLRSRTTVRALEGDDRGRLRRAVLSDGSTVEVDVAVVALGSERNVEWLRGCGIAVDGAGVPVDSACRVLDDAGRVVPGVFAAGDVARAPEAIAGGAAMSVEHWGNAVGQAEVAGHNLAAAECERRTHDAVPVFWSIQFGHVLKSVGVPSLADEVVVVQGSLETRSFVAVLGAGGRTVAAVAMDQSKWLDHYRRAIEAGAPFPPTEPVVDRPDASPVHPAHR